MAIRDPNLQLKYKIFGKEVVFPKGFFLAAGTGIEQNKKSVEEGFKKLQKWLKAPTPQNWNKIFGTHTAFGYQLRNYLLGRKDLGSVKGMDTAKRVFDQLNVKKLIPKDKIIKINELTTGGKGKTLTSISAATWGNTKYSLDETREVIKNFQGGDKWLKANPDSTKIGTDGKNIWRKYANAIRSLTTEQAKLGGFPYGTNSSRKLWANLYRAAYRGNRIEIVGEFADGKLPLNSKGKIDWHLKNKAGVPAWQRVKFKDLESPNKSTFKWNSKLPQGGLQGQIDTALGKGKFIRSTRAYDTGVWLGAEKIDGRTIKDIFREKILRNELLTKPLYNENKVRTSWKEKMIPTEPEYKRYLTSKSPRFSLTEVHHPYGVGVDPYTSESAFRFANRELGRLEQSFEAGNINRAQYLEGIKKVNEEVGGIRAKVGSTFEGARATSSTQVFKEALRYVGKENVDALRKLYTTAAKTNKGGLCNIFRAEGGRIGFAAGSSCVKQMEAAFDADPVRTTQQVSRIKTITGTVKNATQGFLGMLGKFGARAAPLAALAAAGAVLEPLVKQFKIDDPETYLTNENQMKGMLLATIEGETPKVDEEILKWQMPALGAATAAGAIPGAREAYQARRGVGPTGPIPGVGKVRAALGIKGVLGKALGASFSPLAVGATLPMDIAAQRKGGTDWGDIATDPSHWFGPAFASSGYEAAKAGIKNPMLLRALRMGISPGALRMISSKFGLPGLAISSGMWGYDKWKNRNKDGGD